MPFQDGRSRQEKVLIRIMPKSLKKSSSMYMNVHKILNEFDAQHYKPNTECTLLWRHNGRDSVSNHQPHDCLHNRLFRRRSKQTSKFRVTGLCAGNSPGTGEFPAQMASNAENVSIWWRHHERTRTQRRKSSPKCSKVLTQKWQQEKHNIYTFHIPYFRNQQAVVQNRAMKPLSGK